MALFIATRLINSLHSSSIIKSLVPILSSFSVTKSVFVGRNCAPLCSPKLPFSMGSLVSCRAGNYDVSGAGNKNDSAKGKSTMSTSEDEAEFIICAENDVPDEGVKSFDVKGVENGKVLLVKTNGVISAVGAKCTHYGAPLDRGVICGETIRCPFHGACFSLKTGDIEEFPGSDSIPSYDVRISQGQIIIKANKKLLVTSRVMKKLAKRYPANKDVFVVIGGGAAGQKCLESLREMGYTGRLILVSAENVLPYDRPKLSKSMHLPPDAFAMRPEEFYEDADIELMLGLSATGIDASRSISLSNGTSITFNRALLATGGTPLELKVPGADLEGIYYLRTIADGMDIVAAAKGKNVIIVGTSFIGMEVAAFLSSDNRSASVTVIGNSSVPFQRSLGKEIGARVQAWFEEKGVTFHTSSKITEIIGNGGRVSKIKVGETEIDADIIVAGIGVAPCTKFLRGGCVDMDKNGYVIVNENLETSLPGLFCGGDIANFPLPCDGNSQVTISHWQLASNHGNLAAMNMMGKEVAVNTVPFFWTAMYGKSIRYGGHGAFDDIIITGCLDEMKFIAYYCQGDRVVGVSSLSMDPAVARYVAYVKAGNVLTKQEVVEDGKIALKLKC